MKNETTQNENVPSRQTIQKRRESDPYKKPSKGNNERRLPPLITVRREGKKTFVGIIRR